MLEDIIKERKKKVERLREEGIDPYPATSKRTHKAREVIKSFASLKREKKNIFVAGRLRALRIQGNIGFLSVEDDSGRIQVVLRKNNLKDYKIYA